MSDDQYHYSYVLDGHEPVPAGDMLSGVQWKVDHPDQSRVATTFLGDGVIGVYTDFLGLNLVGQESPRFSAGEECPPP